MKQLVFFPDSGLGNRLGGICSGLYYSKITDLPLIIYWERDSHCNVGFFELFKNDIPNVRVIETYNLGIKNESLIKYIWQKIVYWKYSFFYVYVSSREGKQIYKEQGERGISEKILSSKRICIKASSFLANNRGIKDVLQFLKPTEEIYERVNIIMNPYMNCNVIGIHIRRTDHVDSINNSPLELFQEKMRHENLADSRTVYYLATDDEETRNILKKEFSIIEPVRYAKRINRDTSDGIKDAFIDMLCLARCSKIIGSYNSTFSLWASYLGDTELEIVKS